MVEAGRVEAGLYLTDKGFDSGLNTAGGKLDSFAGKVDSVASKAGELGGKLTAGITLPVVGAAAAVLKLSGNFEQSMANVASVTGGGIEAQKKLTEAAREAGATSIFSASQAADAMYFLASSGMDTEQIISSLGGVLAMAGASGLDLAKAADIATVSMAQFQMGASESDRVANAMAATVSATNTDLAQLGAGMAQAGGAAYSANMSFEETAAALGLMANAGKKGSEGGVLLRNMLMSLSKPSKEVNDTLASMGLKAKDVDPTLRSFGDILDTLKSKNITLAQAQGLFGKEMGAGALNAISLADSYGTLVDKVTDTDKAYSMMAIQTNTLWGAMKEMRSAAEELALVFGDVLIPPITSLAKDHITPFVRKLGEMDSGTVKLIATIAGVAAVIGPLLIAFSMMLPAVALLISPIGLLVAGLAALFIGGKLADDWRGAFSALPGIVKTAFTKAVSTAKTVWAGLKGIAHDVANWLRNVDWGAVWDTVILGAYTAFGALQNLGSYIVDGMKSIDWGGMWDRLANIGGTVADQIRSIDWSGIGSTLKTSLASAWDALTDLGGSIKDKILSIDWRGVGQSIIDLIGAGFAAVMDLGSKIKSSIMAVNWSGVGDSIISGIRTVISAASDLGSMLADKFRSYGGWGAIGDTITSAIRTAINAASDLGSAISKKIESYGGYGAIGETIVNAIKKIFSNAIDLATTIGDKIKGWSGWAGVGDKIKDGITGAWKTFTGWHDALKNNLTDFAEGGGAYTIGQKIGIKISDAFGALADFGRKIGEGIHNFFAGGEGQSTAQRVAVAVSNAFTTIQEWASIGRNMISAIFSGIMDGAAPMGLGLKAWFYEMWADILAATPGVNKIAGGYIEQVSAQAAAYRKEQADATARLAPIAEMSWSDASKYTTSGYVPVGTYASQATSPSKASELGISTSMTSAGKTWTSQTGASYTVPTSIAGVNYAITGQSTVADVENIIDDLIAKGFTKAEIPEILKQISTEAGSYKLPAAARSLDEKYAQAGAGAGGELTGISATMEKMQVSMAGVESNTAAMVQGTSEVAAATSSTSANTSGTVQAVRDQIAEFVASRKDWASQHAETMQAFTATQEKQLGPQPGQIMSKADVAGFANAVTYAISPETGKLTAYIGSAGKQLEKLAVNGGTEILNSGYTFNNTVSGSAFNFESRIAAASDTAGILQVGYGQQAGEYQLTNAAQVGQVTKAATGEAASTFKTSVYSSGVDLEERAKVAASYLERGGTISLDSIKEAQSIWSGAINQTAAAWKNTVLTTAQTVSTIDRETAAINGQVATSSSSIAGQTTVQAAITASSISQTASQIAASALTSSANTFAMSAYSSGVNFEERARISASYIESGGAFAYDRVMAAHSSWFSGVDVSAGIWKTAVKESANDQKSVLGAVLGSLAGLAKVVGCAGGTCYTAGGGTTSGQGYSYSAGGMCEELGGPMHGYNALIYTAPNGTVYAINPMTLQSSGGVSGAISSGGATVLSTSSGSSSTTTSSVTPTVSSVSQALASNPYSSSNVTRFASGGQTIDGPRLAIVGDNPSGREAIIPDEVWGGKGGGSVTVIVELDGRRIAKTIAPRMADEIRVVAGPRVR